MSELTEKLKVTRGKGYYTVLKQILAECGQAIADDARAITAETGQLNAVDIGRLALRYDLNFKATCEWLEDSRILPAGTHGRLMRAGIKPGEVFEAVRAAGQR